MLHSSVFPVQMILAAVFVNIKKRKILLTVSSCLFLQNTFKLLLCFSAWWILFKDITNRQESYIQVGMFTRWLVIPEIPIPFQTQYLGLKLCWDLITILSSEYYQGDRLKQCQSRFWMHCRGMEVNLITEWFRVTFRLQSEKGHIANVLHLDVALKSQCYT